MKKLNLAVGYGSICGGCDVVFTDVGEKLADFAEIVQIVYWPAVVDAKIEQLEELSHIDVGIFFGALRTKEHELVLNLLDKKSDVLIAFGTCACYGGIPGLANLASSNSLLNTAYVDAPNTQTEGIPGIDHLDIEKLELPKLLMIVSSPADVVKFDVFVPGCPPPVESVIELINLLKDCQKGYPIPEGYFIAAETSVCDFCEREKPEKVSINEFKRIHEVEFNEDECFLSQGILCLGPVTRGGCGDIPRCIMKNMPCRGCFGPIPNVRDQGTKFLSSIASSIMLGKEKEVSEEELEKLVENCIADPVGLFYRFALSVAIFNRKYSEK